MLKELFDLFKRESQLNQAFERSYEMLGEDKEMFEEAIRSLRERDDARLEIDIYAKDQLINAYEREVRRKVFTHLALSGGKDLNAGLVLVSVVIDIERIGDYTKNIVELALRHPERLMCGTFEKDIRQIETTVKTMFRLLLESLPANDDSKAREVMSEHWWIARKVDEKIITPLIEKNEPSLPCREAVATVLYVRYLKRVSAHLKNIASSVVNPFDRIGYRRANNERKKSE
jgi:phosphate uptake regulator